MTRKEYMNILWMCALGTKIAMVDTTTHSFIHSLAKIMVFVLFAYFFVSVDDKLEK